jgi:hypothetical protein
MRRVLVLLVLVLEHLLCQVVEHTLSTRHKYEGMLSIPHIHPEVADFVHLLQHHCGVAAGSADREGWFW